MSEMGRSEWSPEFRLCICVECFSLRGLAEYSSRITRSFLPRASFRKQTEFDILRLNYRVELITVELRQTSQRPVASEWSPRDSTISTCNDWSMLLLPQTPRRIFRADPESLARSMAFKVWESARVGHLRIGHLRIGHLRIGI